jgi:hypothetical protein
MVRSRFIHVSLLLACCTLVIAVIAGSSVSLIAAPTKPQVSLSQAQTYDLHINAGTTINWFNADSVPHRLRAVDGSWETPVIAPGEQINQPFTTAGLSAFLCDFDPAMRGTIVVQSTHAVFVPLVANITAERWSDPATWGGRLPQAGDAVTIPAGKVVLLDVSPPPLQSLLIEGELRFDRQNLNLTVGWIMLHGRGRLQIGTPTEPFTQRATITLTAANLDEDVMGMGTRGILLMGGTFEAYGQTPDRIWTRLADHAATGSTTLTLAEPVNWQTGDQIVIAPTDFYGVAETERLTVQAANETQVALTTPLQKERWGRLQYVSPTGMTLTPTTEVTPLVLDERAEVGILSRRIVIQGADDERWRNDRFGAHIMVMGNGVLRLNGVELRRMGQGGRFGRYPIHFHMLSYAADGSLIGDATQQLVANSSIWNSANRCITIHGTNGTTIRNNICYDIAGHAIFLEDAVERRNLIENNLVLKVRQPPVLLLNHDREAFRRGPSGFWITNPDNIVRGNVAADAAGNGFWLAFPERPLGSNKLVPIRPANTRLGIFSHNVAHSNGKPGINLDFAPFDDAGNTRESKYIPTSDEGPDRYNANRVRFTFSDITTYKNNDNGLWNRTSWPDYVRFVSADNTGMFFAGAGDDGNIRDSLIVGVSLSNRTPTPIHDQPNAAVASYHSTFDIFDNVIVNFALSPRLDRASGAFATNDYYTRPVDRGLIRNPNNILINSHPGRRVISPNINTPVGNAAIAGALWDPHGYWGPAGNYWVYDIPFLTAGKSCVPVSGEDHTKSCNGPYFGVFGFRVDGSPLFEPRMPLTISRLDAGNQIIDQWIVEDGSGGSRNTFNIVAHMRHFAAVPNGRYRIEFRDAVTALPPPTQEVKLNLSNMHTTADKLILAVPFSGSRTVQAYLTTRELYWDVQQLGTPVRYLTQVHSFASLLTTDNSFWQDNASNQVWVNVSGGMALPGGEPANPLSDEALYRVTYLRIFAP